MTKSELKVGDRIFVEFGHAFRKATVIGHTASGDVLVKTDWPMDFLFTLGEWRDWSKIGHVPKPWWKFW